MDLSDILVVARLWITIVIDGLLRGGSDTAIHDIVVKHLLVELASALVDLVQRVLEEILVTVRSIL